LEFRIEEKNMQKFVVVVVLLGLFSLPLMAQRAEVFGGYQYLRLNDVGGCGYNNGLGCPTINFNGWDASVTGFFNKYLGVTGDFGGAYGSFSEAAQGFKVNFPSHVYTYTGGPVLAFRKGPIHPFVHALVGGAHANVSASSMGLSASASKTAFTMMFGGGVDVRAGKALAFRLIDVDWLYYHYGSGSVSLVGNTFPYNSGSGSGNVRLTTGIVLKF
jgi:hypothetical protein